MEITRDLQNKRVVIHPDRGADIVIELGEFGNILRGSWTCAPNPAFVELWGDPNMINAALNDLGFTFRPVAGAWIIFFNATRISTRETVDEVRKVMCGYLGYNGLTDTDVDERFWFISGYLRCKYPKREVGELTGLAFVVHGYIEEDLPRILEESRSE